MIKVDLILRLSSAVLDADQNTDRQIPVNNPLKHSSSETTEPNGLKIFEKDPPLGIFHLYKLTLFSLF